MSYILTNPQEQWNQIKRQARGKTRVAFRKLDVDWQKYNTKDYLFTHDTACCSVATEDNGYWIKPACFELINANGNAWTNPVLLGSFKTFIGGDNFLEHCFVKGTRVLMSNGTYLPIEEIKQGDKVINRKGQIDTVKNIQIRKSSDLYEIESRSLLNRKIVVTGNHPLYVVNCKKNKNDVFTTYKNSEAQWMEVEKIDDKIHALTIPVSNVVVDNEEINENRAELIGWFLAQGSFTYLNKFHNGASGIQFSLSAKEKDVANRLSQLLTIEFGEHFRCDAKPRQYIINYQGHESSLVLSMCNIKVAQFFMKYCSQHCWSKEMHESLMYIDKKLQKILLKSFFLGDGTFKRKNRGISVCTTSEKLMQQVKFISNRLGLNPTYKRIQVLKRYSVKTMVDGYQVYIDPITGRKKRPGYQLSYSVFDSKLFNEKYDGHSRKTIIFNNQCGEWIVDKFIKNKIQSEQVEVYNLEIENDNSYIAQGIVVHNCQIPSLSKGKILDAIIRPVKHHSDKYNEDADIYYVDILIATNRKHTNLVNRIESGELKTLSMGTLAEITQCSICGKKNYDGDKNCEHIDKNLGQMVTCSDGKQRMCAELCGACDDNGDYIDGSNSFIECSFVQHPAFEGAVVNYFVETPDQKIERESEKEELAKLFESNLFERLRVADTDSKIAFKVLKEYTKTDRIAKKIMDNLI